jgi:hypothetical protein
MRACKPCIRAHCNMLAHTMYLYTRTHTHTNTHTHTQVAASTVAINGVLGLLKPLSQLVLDHEFAMGMVLCVS